ncbi:hypothetical protein TNCV_3691951 [Trichonephila clavipes]|nr:hypothetical protein TNCV_3691951 [Trichonephila clavipes]
MPDLTNDCILSVSHDLGPLESWAPCRCGGSRSPQWCDGEPLGTPAKSGFGPPSWTLQRAVRHDDGAHALGPLELYPQWSSKLPGSQSLGFILLGPNEITLVYETLVATLEDLMTQIVAASPNITRHHIFLNASDNPLSVVSAVLRPM